jgi:hypothetical protein
MMDRPAYRHSVHRMKAVSKRWSVGERGSESERQIEVGEGPEIQRAREQDIWYE